MRYSAIFITIFLSLHLSAQDKVEREDRVSPDQVPAPARSWMQDAFDKTGKVKWYFERTSGKESFEAKLKYRGAHYSVEFSVSGDLEDVEIERDLDELPLEHRRALRERFASLDKFSLQRLQEQRTGSPEDLQASLAGNDVDGIVTLYEIEFVADIEGEIALWEGTFTPDGELLNYRKIILRPTDNLGF